MNNSFLKLYEYFNRAFRWTCCGLPGDYKWVVMIISLEIVDMTIASMYFISNLSDAFSLC